MMTFSTHNTSDDGLQEWEEKVFLCDHSIRKHNFALDMNKQSV